MHPPQTEDHPAGRPACPGREGGGGRDTTGHHTLYMYMYVPHRVETSTQTRQMNQHVQYTCICNRSTNTTDKRTAACRCTYVLIKRPWALNWNYNRPKMGVGTYTVHGVQGGAICTYKGTSSDHTHCRIIKNGVRGTYT